MNHDQLHAQLKVEALQAEAEARRQAKLARQNHARSPEASRPALLDLLLNVLRLNRRSTV